MFDNQAIKYREPYYSNMVLADEIKSESIKEVYYLVTDDSTGFDYNMVEVLQFMCPNLVIEYTNINEYYGSEGDYVLVQPHQKSNLTMYNTEKLSESAVLYLYEIK